MNYNTLLESLPVRPGDTVYYVWQSKDLWRLSEERVRFILFGEDSKLREMITNTKEKSLVYGEDMKKRFGRNSGNWMPMPVSEWMKNLDFYMR